VSGNQNIVLFGDEPFSVSELTAFVLGGRPRAFFFLLVIATGLLLFSTSKKQPPKIKKKYAGPCVHAPKNGGKTHQLVCPHTPVNDEKEKAKMYRKFKKKILMRLTSDHVQGLFPPPLPSSVDSRRKPFSAGSNKHILCVTRKKTKNGLDSKMITHEKLR
jgi:hypothetical protein